MERTTPELIARGESVQAMRASTGFERHMPSRKRYMTSTAVEAGWLIPVHQLMCAN